MKSQAPCKNLSHTSKTPAHSRALTNFSAPTPISDLWRIARAFLADALNAFGGPQTIRQTLDLIARRAIKRAHERAIASREHHT